jgi:hypothetical protein
LFDDSSENGDLPSSFFISYSYGGVVATNFAFRIRARTNGEQIPDQQQSEKLVESIDSSQSEGVVGKVKDVLHLRTETLSPQKFLEGAKSFLLNTGLQRGTKISIDEMPVHPENASTKMKLDQAFDMASQKVKSHEGLRTIEITSQGKNENFSLLLNFLYSQRHLVEKPPLELEVRALPNEFAAKVGESAEDYRVRMNALDSDVKKSQELLANLNEQKKKLYSDFRSRLPEAFPGVKIEIFEMVALD